MGKIRNLDDMARDLIESVAEMDAGRLAPKDLAVKQNAYRTVVRIAALKLQVYMAARETPDKKLLQIMP